MLHVILFLKLCKLWWLLIMWIWFYCYLLISKTDVVLCFFVRQFYAYSGSGCLVRFHACWSKTLPFWLTACTCYIIQTICLRNEKSISSTKSKKTMLSVFYEYHFLSLKTPGNGVAKVGMHEGMNGAFATFVHTRHIRKFKPWRSEREHVTSRS